MEYGIYSNFFMENQGTVNCKDQLRQKTNRLKSRYLGFKKLQFNKKCAVQKPLRHNTIHSTYEKIDYFIV